MATPSTYAVYGLTVASELPLGGLAPASGVPDVVVRFGDVQAQAERPIRAGCFEADAERIFVYQPKAGFLLAEGGRTLIIEVPGGHDTHFMESIVLGRGLAAILHQRGVFTLHAGAVAIDGHGLAFIGERGQGKSTTTAAFLRHGARLVTDDLLPVRFQSGRPVVFTGGSHLKLWPQSAEAAGGSLHPHTRVADHVDKRYWSAEGRLEGAAVPLRAVYELAFGDDFELKRHAPRAAFAALHRHAFTGGLAATTGQGPGYLRRVASVAEHTPVYGLIRPRDLTRLDELVDLLWARTE